MRMPAIRRTAVTVAAAVALFGAATCVPAAPQKENRMPEMWVQQSQDEVRAGNGRVSIGFAKLGNVVVLKSFAKQPGDAELLTEPAAADHLWELEFGPAGGERVTVSSADAPSATLDARGGDECRITLRWPGIPVGGGHVDVEAVVRLGPRDPVTRWSLAVTNPERNLDLWSITFPIIPNLQARPRTALAFPTGWGLMFEDALQAGELDGTYPSMSPAMQFVACWRGRAGMYFAAHDPTAGHKRFVCAPDSDRGRLRLAIVNYPAGMGRRAGLYELPYQAAIGAFAGDWYTAARLHREWALRSAPWMAQGELRARDTTPAWLKAVDLWCLGSGGPADVVQPVKQFASYFGVPTAVHWYNWHQIPFDDHYPEYFPTKEGFAQGVAELQAAGIKVMPYINGRLWDPRTDSWSAENAQAACAKDENLNRCEETYGSGVPLVVMCPYTEKWRAKVTSLVDRLVNECGVDGVYIDQISAAPAKLCFDPQHGHAVGGGGFWAAGYRRMLEQARRELPPDRMLTTEENADPWIDLLDAFLLVNTPPGRGEVVPLFPAVYAGRTITFGFQYIAGGDLDNGLPFRAKMARAFAWGAQLGWVGPQILDHKYAAEAQYLRTLARCRSRAHEFLVFGEMLEPPAVFAVPRIAVDGKAPFGGEYHIELPAVISSAWRADNGDVGVALTNMTDQEQTVKLSLSRTRLRLPRRSGCALARITEAGERTVGELTGARLMHEEALPPRSAVVLRVSAATG